MKDIIDAIQANYVHLRDENKLLRSLLYQVCRMYEHNVGLNEPAERALIEEARAALTVCFPIPLKRKNE